MNPFFLLLNIVIKTNNPKRYTCDGKDSKEPRKSTDGSKNHPANDALNTL